MSTITTIIKNILPYGISYSFVRKRTKRRELQQPIPSSEEPPVYNADGIQLKTIFLKDDEFCRDQPYNFVNGRYPNYILWDRNNYGLKNHVYVHKNITDKAGKPIKRFAFLLESESILPDDYKIFDMNPGLEKDFDLIFTHSAKLLNKYPNAVFIPGGGVWYGTQNHGGSLNPEQYKIKSKNISLVSSAKIMCRLHEFRLGLAHYYKKNSCVDTYGTFDGDNPIKISESLEQYRYSIVIENEISSYWFTEKILNCFASMTIPIYIGAIDIGNFFNMDGIIQISDLTYDTIDKVIKDCNEKNYLMRKDAITDNFLRVQEFLCIEDYLYNHYKGYFA